MVVRTTKILLTYYGGRYSFVLPPECGCPIPYKYITNAEMLGFLPDLFYGLRWAIVFVRCLPNPNTYTNEISSAQMLRLLLNFNYGP